MPDAQFKSDKTSLVITADRAIARCGSPTFT
jgi:hypothetical protein